MTDQKIYPPGVTVPTAPPSGGGSEPPPPYPTQAAPVGAYPTQSAYPTQPGVAPSGPPPGVGTNQATSQGTLKLKDHGTATCGPCAVIICLFENYYAECKRLERSL